MIPPWETIEWADVTRTIRTDAAARRYMRDAGLVALMSTLVT